MTKKPDQPLPERPEKPQRQRFIDFAREVGADKDEKALDRVFPKVADQRAKPGAS